MTFRLCFYRPKPMKIISKTQKNELFQKKLWFSVVVRPFACVRSILCKKLFFMFAKKSKTTFGIWLKWRENLTGNQKIFFHKRVKKNFCLDKIFRNVFLERRLDDSHNIKISRSGDNFFNIQRRCVVHKINWNNCKYNNYAKSLSILSIQARSLWWSAFSSFPFCLPLYVMFNSPQNLHDFSQLIVQNLEQKQLLQEIPVPNWKKLNLNTAQVLQNMFLCLEPTLRDLNVSFNCFSTSRANHQEQWA